MSTVITGDDKVHMDPVFIHRPRVRFAARGQRNEDEHGAQRLLDRERSIRFEGKQAAGARAVQPDSQRASNRARAPEKSCNPHINRILLIRAQCRARIVEITL
jgi:hypothetical protein